MESFFVVEVPNRSLWFDILYVLAFLLVFSLLVFLGYKKKYPSLAWLLMLACAWLLFVIGCKLPTYSATDWQQVLTYTSLPRTSQMMVLGGILFGGIGIVFGRWWGRLPLAAIDLFALALPVGMAVQRFGCFVVGCCFGRPVVLPWAVQYGAGTLPHRHQYNEGLVSIADPLSLAVHPTQLYELLVALLMFSFVLLSRRYWKAAGNIFLSSVIFYGCMRFFVEFYSRAYAATVSGFSFVQLALLLVLPLLLFLLLYREYAARRSSAAVPEYHANEHGIGWNLLLIVVLVLAFWSLRNWLVIREIVVLNIVFLPLLATAAVKAFRSLTHPAYRWLTAGVLVLPLLLMSQTLPPQPADSAYQKTYTTVSLGYGRGEYENYYSIGQGEGCDRISTTEYYRQKYSVVGGGVSWTKEKNKETIIKGVNVYGGTHTQSTLSTGKQEDIFLFGIAPYLRYDTRYVGIGGGVHIGNLTYTLENKNQDGNTKPESGLKHIPMYPLLYLQLGPRDIIFARFQLADHFPSALPGLRYQLSIGSGFGLKNGASLRFGTNTIDPFLALYLPLKDTWVIESHYLWGESSTPNSFTQRQFSLGVHYRFNHKEKGVKEKKGEKKKKKALSILQENQ